MRSRSMIQAGAVFALQTTSFALQSPTSADHCPVSLKGHKPSPGCHETPSTFLSNVFAHTMTGAASRTKTPKSASVDILENAFAALAVLQNQNFDVTQGTWPSSIDWTAAVIETVVAGMLKTLATSLDSASPEYSGQKLNLVSVLYDHVIRFFFGQRQQEILQQAYDDMQWVVLGWIEAATFAESYGQMVFPHAASGYNKTIPLSIDSSLNTLPWYGSRWIPSFFNRSEAFWHAASAGWDTSLCHGGMNWNPRLQPYKNAITNELWIATSVDMYLYYKDELSSSSSSAHEQGFLGAAVKGYQWLMLVNMTNSQGLFVDGYHVNGAIPHNVECDERDEMVYTYNQGVVLTGQRGLFIATSNPRFLRDGHELIQSVILATGWDGLARFNNNNTSTTLPTWRGLGRGGILEDQCDASGTCSQDSQTFKAIFFHHLTAFCKPLDIKEFQGLIDMSSQINKKWFSHVKAAHVTACRSYLAWVKFNAEAALKTRDAAGRFGMWWGAPFWGNSPVSASGFQKGIGHSSTANTTDYRNIGTPMHRLWGLNSTWQPGSAGRVSKGVTLNAVKRAGNHTDANDRGRGRTVETQIGGVALLRAWWELSRLPRDDNL